jgi:hypothetical protein
VFCFQAFGHALYEKKEKHRCNVVSLFDTHSVVNGHFFLAEFKFEFKITVEFSDWFD